MVGQSGGQVSFVPRILNGGIAGVVGVSCVFPIDLCKTRIQNQQIGPDGKRLYRSIADCFFKTYRAEGFRGLYSGVGVNVLLITPEKAIKLVGNDMFRFWLRNSKGQLTLPREMVAGGAAATCQMIVTTPMELLKIQLQDAGRSGSKTKMSATSIALSLFREKGIFSLYRGLGSTMLRDITFSAIYFPLFAHLNTHGKSWLGKDQEVFYVSFLAGLVAGCLGAMVANPFDVVKTRLQTLKRAAGEREFNGIIDCFVKTYRHEGVLAFFKGGLARVLVIAPLFGIAQAVYYLGVAEYVLGYKRQGQL